MLDLSQLPAQLPSIVIFYINVIALLIIVIFLQSLFDIFPERHSFLEKF